MRIAIVYDKTAPHTTGVYLETALRQSRHRVDHYWTSRAAEIPQGYDLYLRIDHGDYAHDLPEHLRPSIFYAIDTHLEKPYRRIREQARRHDLVCCAQREGAERLQRETDLAAEWLPLGCEPELHASPGGERTLDVAFVGTDGKRSARPRLLRILRHRYTNAFIGQAPHIELGRLYGSAKIGFNCSIQNDVNMRMFEVMAAGALLVTNQIEENGIDELFRAGEHYVVYRNALGMLEAIEHYLSHEVERAAIAEAGRQLVLSQHTYHRRVVRLLALASARLRKRYPQLAIDQTLPLLEVGQGAGDKERGKDRIAASVRSGAADA